MCLEECDVGFASVGYCTGWTYGCSGCCAIESASTGILKVSDGMQVHNTWVIALLYKQDLCTELWWISSAFAMEILGCAKPVYWGLKRTASLYREKLVQFLPGKK